MDSKIKSNINATINILDTWIPMKIKYSINKGELLIVIGRYRATSIS